MTGKHKGLENLAAANPELTYTPKQMKENAMKLKSAMKMKGEAMKLKEEKAAVKMGHSPKKKVSYAEAKKNNPNLDKLIKTRSGAEKGSPEYVKAQNAINKAYGVSKRHSVTGGAAKKPGVEELVSSKTKTSSTKGKTTTATDKKVDMKGAEVTTTKTKPNKTKSVTVTQDADGKLSGR